MKKISFLVLFFTTTVAQAQNNPIFNGGNADGWGAEAFAQATNAIHAGGNGEGWAFSSYLQQPHNIFAGGEGDGWNYAGFLQAGNFIFNGGDGDGWASTYRPLGVLPVTWLSFTATKLQAKANLHWQTALEQNTSRFIVERKGTEGVFSLIGSVNAAGNSSTVTSYFFVDPTPLKGINFYRIQQVDINGASTYSAVRAINFDAHSPSALMVYPVPASVRIFSNFPGIVAQGKVNASIVSVDGKLVKQFQMNGLSGGQLVEINISSLVAGSYYLKMESGGIIFMSKFIKQ